MTMKLFFSIDCHYFSSVDFHLINICFNFEKRNLGRFCQRFKMKENLSISNISESKLASCIPVVFSLVV